MNSKAVKSFLSLYPPSNILGVPLLLSVRFAFAKKLQQLRSNSNRKPALVALGRIIWSLVALVFVGRIDDLG